MKVPADNLLKSSSSVFCVFLLAFLFVFEKSEAQSSQIQQLEQELISLSGAARVQKLLQISEALFQTGLYEKSSDRADEAGNLARKIGARELHARSLHWEAKGLAKAEKKTMFGKSKAAPKFLLSNEILKEIGSKDVSLFISNLEELKTIAVKNGRTDDAQRLENQIAAARSGNLNPAAAAAPDSKKELREEVSKLEQERANLNQKLEQQLAAQASTSKKSEDLKKQSAVLMTQLAEKEAAISQMNEEQMKNELLLMQQNQLLDSLSYRASMDSLNLRNQDLAISEAKSSRNFFIAAAVALLLLCGGSLYSFFKAKQYNKIIQAEQKRSEDLLLNILPALVAKELKKQGYTDPQFHDSVAVLFADFVGFSKIAEILSPAELVRELDTCFKAFDTIIAKHGLEKIKTIGDAYMAASGLTDKENGYVLRMVQAAKEMQNWLNIWNAERSRHGLPRFDARIGIHAGPVVAGVVGSKKFAYDIWGDTVNIAARVEQAGEGGKINISGDTYKLIQDLVPAQYRGAIEAKNKGKIEMYYLDA